MEVPALGTRLGAWWWYLLVILKGLLLSLSQVLFMQGTLQAYWRFFVTLLYTTLLCVVCPWLQPYAYFLDVCCMMPLLFFCAMASWFCEHESGLESMVSSYGRQFCAQEL